ncbi:MAG: hypothetical protein IMF07_04295 [Proteobacteria bacterium]|nr:hypothetical protein [Pseudomonadota bacterium]
MPRAKFFILVFLSTILFACSSGPIGLIYTNTTLPLTTNMKKTPRGKKLVVLGTKHINIEGLAAEWDSRAIGDAAKRGNLRLNMASLKKVYYADINKVSIFLGMWKKNTVRVWGE